MSRSQSSWDEISTEGVKLSNTALNQWHVLVDQAKLTTAANATREEKFTALQNIVQSNPQQYPFLGESYFTLLDGEIKTMQTELTTLSKGSAALAPHVKQFSQIAQAASIFAGLVSPKAAHGLDKIATGGFLLHSSLKEIAASGTSVVAASGTSVIAASETSVAASGSMFGPTALCVAAVVLIGQGLYDLVVSDDPEPSDELALAFQAVFAGLLQISQQINHLGEYIEKRFDRLEEFLDRQHHETLHQLQRTIFNNTLNATEIKELLRSQKAQNKDMMQALTVLHKDLVAYQQTETDSRLRNHSSMLTELHSIQTQSGCDLVNSVRQSLNRNTPIDEATFKQQSATLCRIIRAHGTASLAGGNLLGDREASQSLILNPLSKNRSPEEIIQLANHNPELLKSVAIANNALPATQSVPNLVLLKDRLIAFYDWHIAYAKDNNHSIPQDALEDLREVTATLSDINKNFLQAVDFKKLMTDLLSQLKENYNHVQTAAERLSAEFSREKTKAILIKRFEQIQTQEELLAHTNCAAVTEANKIFDFDLIFGHGDYTYPRKLTDTPRRIVQLPVHPALRELPIPKEANSSDDSYLGNGFWSLCVHPNAYWALANKHHQCAWPSINYKKFFVELMPFAPKSLQEENARNPINWDEQVGDRHIERKRNHAAVIQDFKIKCREMHRRLMQLQNDQAAIDLFDSHNPFQSLDSILVIGPRLVASENSDIPFQLCLTDSTMFEKFIPKSILMAEFLGLGKLEFKFNAVLSDPQEHTRQFLFSIQVQFIPADGLPILILLHQHPVTVSSVYKDVADLTYDYWYGNPVYDSNFFELTCMQLKHNNDKHPIHKRSRLQTPLDMLRTVEKDAKYDRAETKGSQLTAAHLQMLQMKSNESLDRLLHHPSHTLGSCVFQLEMTAAYIKLFTGLLMPQYLDEMLAALSRISYLERSAYQHCLRDTNRSLVAKLSENKVAFDNGVPRIFAIVVEALQRNHQQQKPLGDPKLHQLKKQFVEHAEKITVSTTPVVSASNANVNALHAVIAAQSEKIERMSTQIEVLTAEKSESTKRMSTQIEELTVAQVESTKQLNAKIDGLTAMIERLLAQQTAQSSQAGQSAASGPRLFGVA